MTEIEQPYKNELDKLYVMLSDNNQEIDALRRERENFTRIFSEKNSEIDFLRKKMSENMNKFHETVKKDRQEITSLNEKVQALNSELNARDGGREAESVVLSKFDVMSLGGGD